jgi:hypothetical protein
MKGVAVLIGLLAASLGGMWAHFAHHNALTGDVPAGSRSVETDTVVHLGMALDLTLLVPLYAGSAVLLWRRSPWGFVLGMIALLAGLLHQLSYMVAMPIQVAAGIPGASSYDAGEPVIVSLYLLGILLLLRPIRRGTAGSATPVARPRPIAEPRRRTLSSTPWSSDAVSCQRRQMS